MKNDKSAKTIFENQSEWISAIKSAIMKKNCKALLLSGASAAGKTFMSEELKKVLEKDKKRVFIFSTDNFYKGITRNILDKAEKNFYSGKIDNKQEIIDIVRAHSIELQFQEKYSDKSVEELRLKLKNIAPDDLVDNLKTEFERINFDEPEAVDLDMATNFMNTLILEPDRYVTLPEYSFLTGEYKLLDKNNVKGEDYDFFIMEGIFSLNKKIIDGLKIDVVKSFVECHLNTLLIRKLNRDITKGRSSMTKEGVVLSYLNTIIPAYFTHISPTRENADFVFVNAYSTDEANNILTSDQQKYRIDINDLPKLDNFDMLKECKQVDYFFAYKGDSNIISLREEDNELIELNYKSNGNGMTKRTSESIRFKGELSEKYKDALEFSQLFMNAGFDFEAIVRKTRKLYNIGDIFFRYDIVKGLGNEQDKSGHFIELMGENKIQIDYIRKQLNLTDDKKCGSYFAMMREKTDQDRTCKLKIKEIPEFILNNENINKPITLKQYYLDHSNNHCNYIIKQNINLTAKSDNSSNSENNVLKAIREAKIIVDELDDKKFRYILIVKYGRNFLNQRKEKEISAELAQLLIEKYATASIEKLSYQIVATKDYKIDIDKYENITIKGENTPLIACVINYNNMTKNEAINTLKDVLKLSDEDYHDITFDLKFSNRNLKSYNILT